MISLDYRDARPIYEQIRDGLRRLIVTGVLAPDERLPSVRALATELAINPNTIQRAYAELEAEGYTYSVAGKGSFAAQNQDRNRLRRGELLDRLTEILVELQSESTEDLESNVARIVQWIEAWRKDRGLS